MGMSGPLPIKIGDRWVIVGFTGSGKTTLSKALLNTLAIGTSFQVPTYIVDSKISGDFAQYHRKGYGKRVAGNTPPRPILQTKGQPFVVWQPEYDDGDMYDDFLKNIHYAHKKAGVPFVLYVDELSSLTNQTGSKYPRHLDIIQKQGRGLNQGIVTVTQSPSFIPPQILRQATHVVRMQLNDEYDVEKLAKVMGKAVLEPPEDDYGFWYRCCLKPVKKMPPVYYSDFTELFS